MFKDFLIVGLGGSLGAVARYSFYLLEKSYASLTFPFATLLINTLGCFIAGMLLSAVEKNDLNERNLLLFLIMGFLGSFTTFSAFTLDNYQLFRSGQAHLAFLNMTLSLSAGLGAAWLGSKLLKLF